MEAPPLPRGAPSTPTPCLYSHLFVAPSPCCRACCCVSGVQHPCIRTTSLYAGATSNYRAANSVSQFFLPNMASYTLVIGTPVWQHGEQLTGATLESHGISEQ